MCSAKSGFMRRHPSCGQNHYDILKDDEIDLCKLATDTGFWCSPPKDELPKLTEPTKPLPSDVNAGATAISQLDPGQQAMYSNFLHNWRFERTEYTNTKRREGGLLMEISRTIATCHLYLINGKDEINDQLIALKQQLAPTAAARRRELIGKYRALQEKP
ncbi:hypothetical protein CC86DRAFT_436549 [Ophiobolus disseminans]|uniref:Uncharacterized protein n=1 Tax=Ophiobolus disseminans TaxID=1469910 RepID=A0A6A7A6L3_9PLEO|nr:hypothetical protein CC86DRAFT_436549 [Ophiobolus disseminans]